MDKPKQMIDPYIPLRIEGFEAGTAQDVFVPTVPLDAALLMLLESCGFEMKSGIRLLDGRVIDGWIRI